jgi:hypothetical protein
LPDDVPDVQESFLFALRDGGHEALVELVREQRVRQLSEIHLKHAAHAVDVLQDAFVTIKIRNAVFIERVPTIKIIRTFQKSDVIKFIKNS